MAKRDSSRQTQEKKEASSTPTADAMEQRLVAFAEQIGRIAGTVSARAEGLVDREALKQQIADVRDSAIEMLEHLSEGVTSLAKRTVGKESAKAAPAAKMPAEDLVHAPGKKHRKPMPKDPRAVAADTKHSRRASAKSSMKPLKRRGRG